MAEASRVSVSPQWKGQPSEGGPERGNRHKQKDRKVARDRKGSTIYLLGEKRDKTARL